MVVTVDGTKEDFGKNTDKLTKNITEDTLAFCGVTGINVSVVRHSCVIAKDGGNIRNEGVISNGSGNPADD